ncbi:MAG: DUF86 domain-containing protein [Flavobacteriales bacterium]|nr:DUF86 domain-containing protein [Crocinitomicaceae bacterium]NBX81006.1 DUF86 domain-containing protein [Flavobacteriales bacterium]NCA20451.1 DUF86 domain-containing protein [Crocinitomicaceae bacterium]
MDNEVKKLLKDVLIALENIELYIGEKKLYSEYENNFLLQDAVERNLITIGEAINLLLKRESAIAISNARRIVDTRNRLTHGYDDIDCSQVWNIIINHLPTLRNEVQELLGE